MKVKVDSLIGKALDWAVAMAENPNREQYVLDIVAFGYHPSIDWYDGGIIIEREKIDVLWSGGEWCAYTMTSDGESQLVTDGPTPLIAAMRGYVASRFGDEIEVPEELK